MKVRLFSRRFKIYQSHVIHFQESYCHLFVRNVIICDLVEALEIAIVPREAAAAAISSDFQGGFRF